VSIRSKYWPQNQLSHPQLLPRLLRQAQATGDARLSSSKRASRSIVGHPLFLSVRSRVKVALFSDLLVCILH
jgi:hypothetical protein